MNCQNVSKLWPVCIQHVGEWCARVIILKNVGKRWEDENSHGKKEHQKPQLFVTVFEGETKTLEAHGMTSKFEDSENGKKWNVTQLIGRGSIFLSLQHSCLGLNALLLSPRYEELQLGHYIQVRRRNIFFADTKVWCIFFCRSTANLSQS